MLLGVLYAAKLSSIPLGTIKQWMKPGHVLMKGLEKVHAEFNLTALVYNLRRAHNILGMEKLMGAITN